MTDPHPGDEDVLQLGPRRPRWTIPVLILVGLAVAVAAAAAVARHRTRHGADHPTPAVPSAPSRPLARGALVVADDVGVGATSFATVDAGHVTIGISVVNVSPSAITPIYPLTATINGRPLSALRFAGLYAVSAGDPAAVTSASPRLRMLATGQVVALVVQLDMTCHSALAQGPAPTIEVAVKGMRGTADFDLETFAGGWSALRTEVCTPGSG